MGPGISSQEDWRVTQKAPYLTEPEASVEAIRICHRFQLGPSSEHAPRGAESRRLGHPSARIYQGHHQQYLYPPRCPCSKNQSQLGEMNVATNLSINIWKETNNAWAWQIKKRGYIYKNGEEANQKQALNTVYAELREALVAEVA